MLQDKNMSENIYDRLYKTMKNLEKINQPLNFIILREDVKDYIREEDGKLFFEMKNEDGTISRFEVFIIDLETELIYVKNS